MYSGWVSTESALGPGGMSTISRWTLMNSSVKEKPLSLIKKVSQPRFLSPNLPWLPE